MRPRMMVPIGFIVLAAPVAPLGAQCLCPRPAGEEKASTFGAEQLGVKGYRLTMFALRSTELPRNAVGTEFSLAAAFAPYPLFILEAGPAANLTHGPVSLLLRVGLGAVIIPPTPEVYAGVGLLVRVTERAGIRLDASRRFFSIDSRIEYFETIGVGVSVLTFRPAPHLDSAARTP